MPPLLALRAQSRPIIVVQKAKRFLFVLLALGGIGYVYSLDLPRVNRASYDKIQPGMTRTQVEEIFRAPPGCYVSAKTAQRFMLSSQLPEYPDGAIVWVGDEAGVSEEYWFVFDDLEVIVDRGLFENRFVSIPCVIPSSLLDRVRAFLGL